MCNVDLFFMMFSIRFVVYKIFYIMNGELFRCLNDLGTIRSGQTFKSRLDEYAQGNLTVLLPKDIVNKKIDNCASKIDGSTVSQLKKHILKKGEIIIVNKGTRFNTYLYDGVIPNVITTTAFYVITPGQGLLPEYLYWYLNQQEAKRYFNENVQGSVIPAITKTILAQLPVPILPLNEQQYIHEFICKTNIEQELMQQLIHKKELFNESHIWEHIQKHSK